MSFRPLSQELQQKAVEQLNEVPERIQEDLQSIKEWLAKQPHMNARTDDQWLLGFLRNTKFSLQRTKEKLESFYTAKTLMPELCADKDPFLPDIQEYFNCGIGIFLPKKVSPTEPTAMLSLMGHINPDIVSGSTGVKGSLMIVDYLLMEDDNFAVSGLQLLVDVKNIPFKYGMQFTPPLLIKIVKLIQNAYPVRIKGVHFLNMPPIFQKAVNFMRDMLPEKIKHRVNFYTEDTISDVYKYIPLETLPNEYGGNAGTLTELIAQSKQRIESHREWFLDEANYGTDETKRLGKLPSAFEDLGADGSFRKLDFD